MKIVKESIKIKKLTMEEATNKNRPTICPISDESPTL